VKLITKKDKGKVIRVQLHELFGVEVETTHPDNEYLAVPSFVAEQSFEIIKEYNYQSLQNSNVQEVGKKIFLLMATRVSQLDLSWYNLATAQEEIQFQLKIQPQIAIEGVGHHASDNEVNHSTPHAISRSC